MGHYKNWDWSDLSVNPNITWDIVNITFDLVRENLDNPLNFLYNLFTLQNKLIEEQCKKELLAVNKIKKNWIIVFWNPEYKIGRKRLLRSLETEEYSVW